MKIDHGTLAVEDDPTPWVVVSPNSDKEWCVLWLQGWTSTIEGHLEGIKRMSEQSGVTFAMLNYAGHGDHPTTLEESTKKMQFEEICAAYDALQQNGYRKIIVIGGSFGGYMSALLASAKKPYAVVLRAPANYPDEEFEIPYKQTMRYEDQGVYKKFSDNLVLLDRSKAVRSIADYTGQVFITQHELDSIIPKSLPKRYFHAAKYGNYIFVPKTDHSPKFMKSPKKYYDLIEHWVISIIKAVQLSDRL